VYSCLDLLYLFTPREKKQVELPIDQSSEQKSSTLKISKGTHRIPLLKSIKSIRKLIICTKWCPLYLQPCYPCFCVRSKERNLQTNWRRLPATCLLLKVPNRSWAGYAGSWQDLHSLMYIHTCSVHMSSLAMPYQVLEEYKCKLLKDGWIAMNRNVM
jgi:hypothetical protein